MKISEIQAKDKKPFRAYFNRIPIWWKYHERTQAIFDYANERYYQLPTNKLAYDDYIRGVVKEGLFDKLDLHYIFSGDGDINFRLINIINPETYNGTAFGGLEWSAEGVKGNGVNGYIDTNFNPSLLVEGQKYQGLNASVLSVIFSTGSSSETSVIMGNGLFNNEWQLRNILYESNKLNTYNNNLSYNIPFKYTETGFKYLSRVGGVIEGVDKQDYYPDSYLTNPDHMLMRNVNVKILAVGGSNILFSELGLMIAGLGSSLTYEQTQVFREIYNKYLSSIDLEPIA